MDEDVWATSRLNKDISTLAFFYLMSLLMLMKQLLQRILQEMCAWNAKFSEWIAVWNRRHLDIEIVNLSPVLRTHVPCSKSAFGVKTFFCSLSVWDFPSPTSMSMPSPVCGMTGDRYRRSSLATELSVARPKPFHAGTSCLSRDVVKINWRSDF